MAVVYEDVAGTELVRAYSDSGFKIHGGNPGGDYDEAVDPKSMNRTYTETDILIDDGEATEADYVAALEKVGVTFDEETETE